ncbi:MAG: biotin-dependent carboxyltransferase family protein [Rhodocyclaceae bacterium]|nr:biotin-dependent carboxyltransferase family protein [Rhodocyclaceae bacterium]
MLDIIRPGIQTTVQDLGRHGYRHLGVAQCGAMDGPALWLANRLVNNAANLAGLEMVAGPIEIRFERAAWFALTGADFAATLDGQAVHSGWRNHSAVGQVLKLHGAKAGMRAYLAVDGGIAVAEILGGRATDIQAKFGGFKGRALKAGDQLPLGPTSHLERRIGAWQAEWSPQVRVLPGPEFEQFSPDARATFFEHAWTISAQSNRMAYRLEGPVLTRNVSGELLSHGVLPGVVQVPSNGQPIVLLADSQTTGGYPRIAVVIEADLWKFAQAPAGRKIHFVETDLDGACAAREEWRHNRYRFELSAYGNHG